MLEIAKSAQIRIIRLERQTIDRGMVHFRIPKFFISLLQAQHVYEVMQSVYFSVLLLLATADDLQGKGECSN